jgi:hypothetical protein
VLASRDQTDAMTEPHQKPSSPPLSETSTVALSPAARAVSECLSGWRTRVAETQTLVRLTLSLLQGPASAMTDEQRERLGRLTSIEDRVLAQLPRPDLATLRSTTNARESGVELRGPDVLAAELYLEQLRRSTGEQLVALGNAIASGQRDGLTAKLDAVRRTLDELARAVDLLETMLYARLSNPTITIALAVERATGARGQSATLAGATDCHVEQVRGLFRLLTETIASVGDDAYVYASREPGGWLCVTIAPLATNVADGELSRERVELLRLAAYLLRVGAERADGAWKLTFVARDP